MKKSDQQPRRKADLRTLDAATLAHVTGGQGGGAQPDGSRQDAPSMLGEKGAFDVAAR